MAPGGPLIVGAGPTGLAAALFLAERGVRARIVDRAPEPNRNSRAQVVNPRSLELLEASGVAAAVVAEGRSIRGVRFYEDWRPLAGLEITGLALRHPMTVLPQARTEALLAEALRRHGIEVERAVEFLGLTQDEREVRVALRGPGGEEAASASLLFAADGAHSPVRKALGFGFPGDGFPETWPLLDVALDDPLDLDRAHVNLVDGGLVFLLAIRPGLWRVFGNLPDLRALLPRRANPGAVEWESSFHIGHRAADRLVEGRVALGGDASHIHSPVGGRGMNLGIEDAFVYAACAADALSGAPGRLADYARLRHPVHGQVVARMRRLTTLARGRPRWLGAARRYVMPAIAAFPPAAQLMRRTLTGMDHQVRTR